MILGAVWKPFSPFSYLTNDDRQQQKPHSDTVSLFQLSASPSYQTQADFGRDHVVSILTTSWLTPQKACCPLNSCSDCFVFCLFSPTPSSSASPTASADRPCLMPPLLPCWCWLSLTAADCWLLIWGLLICWLLLGSLVAALIQPATRTSSWRTRSTSSCIRAPTMLHSRFCKK